MIYSQSTGVLTSADGTFLATGYSGNGQWRDNPKAQDVRMHGPLPQGGYTIQPPTLHPKLGVVAMELVPDAENEMFGRSAFFMHGDTAAMNHTASDGCIILPYIVRSQIAAGLDEDNRLTVTE
jgi:hypothetical protein